MRVVVPVTRPDPTRFASALRMSDVPLTDLVLLVDAPGCTDAWMRALPEAQVVETGSPKPPDEPIARRARHLAMRQRTQEIVGTGRVLMLEDDTIVCADVTSRLAAVLDAGYDAASGVQVSRHGVLRTPGVWRIKGTRFCTLWGTGVEQVDAVGHYCLMTTGEVYRRASTEPGPPPFDAIDRAHTSRMGRVAVDWDCVVGHDTGDEIIVYPLHLIAYEGMREVARMPAIRTQAGTFWPEMHGPDYDPTVPYDDDGIQRLVPGPGGATIVKKEEGMLRGKTYVYVKDGQYQRITGLDERGHQVVLAGRRQEIPLEVALTYQRLGFIDDPQLVPLMHGDADPPDPRKATIVRNPAPANTSRKKHPAEKK